MKALRTALFLSLCHFGVFASSPLTDQTPVIKADVKLEVLSSTTKDLRIAFTLTNTGSEEYEILKTPISPLQELYLTDKFYISKKSDPSVVPGFKGIKLKWDIKTAAKAAAASGDPTYVAVFKKGVTRRVVHQLRDLYDFSKSGTGVYTASVPPFVELIDLNGRVQVFQFKSQPTVDFIIRSTNVRSSDSNQQVLDAKDITSAIQDFCTPTQRTDIQLAARLANSRTVAAWNRANVGQAGWGALLQEWFGVWNAGRAQTVKDITSRLKQDELRNYKYFCNCPNGDQWTFAYVWPRVYREVFLCAQFWAANVDQGYNTRAGTIIHEASHFVDIGGGTDDHVYGLDECRALAIDKPGQAVKNADSYEYLAETP